MCARKGIEREICHPREFGERLLEIVFHFQRTLACLYRLQGVQTGKLGQVGHLLVDAGIVFHRTTAQWVETIVHPEVVAAVVSVMTHHRKFIALR